MATDDLDLEALLAEFKAERELDEADLPPSTFTAHPKNPRASARRKLRRRIVNLELALENVEWAIGEVFSTAGRVNKESELRRLQAAIAAFREETGLRNSIQEDYAPTSDDALFKMFEAAEQTTRNAIANSAPLMSSLDLSPAKDEDD
ncbi:hypothetical protein O7A70_27420 [Mesorhizobium sp. Cs1299R1N1]|uniref:hypothetical protein n=1 Tax=unclassified Mesorhizobium TaxID=325217 RepID=UPI00301CD446